MNKNVLFDGEFGIAVLKNKGIAIDVGSNAKNSVNTIEKTYASSPWIHWGNANSYPKEIFDKVALNTIIPTTLQWKANTVSRGCVRPGYYAVDDAGVEKFIRVRNNPDINYFMRQNNLLIYSEEILRDLYWWNMAYADFGLTKDRSKIVNIVCQEAFEVRIGRQNEKTGLKDFVYLNANWPSQEDSYISKIRAVDPYYDLHGQVANGSDERFIYPLSFAIPGKKYYQDAPWHSIIFSKWIDIAEKIPKVKSKMMDNQMHIKYVVHVPVSWWEWKFKDWNSKPLEQEARRILVTENFNSVLTGIENQGKTLVLTYNDKSAAKEYAKWEIKELNSRMSASDYLEDSAEASLHTLFALDVDPTLKGNSPGKQMGAGSGSDKRVAMNIFILNNEPFQDKCTAPLNFIAEYNEWKGPAGEQIIWRYENYLMATEETKSDNQRM